jgi:hypothetical protein
MHEKEIVKLWLQGDHYPTFTIPKEFAREYGLDKPTRIVIEKTSQGLLLKKFEIA